MVFDSQVRTPNYSLQCVDGTVYILGVARTQTELDHVLNYARNIPNVRQVKNYIRIRSGIGEDGRTQLGTAGGNQQPSALSSPGADQPSPDQPGVSQRATGPGDSRDPALTAPNPSAPVKVTPLQ